MWALVNLLASVQGAILQLTGENSHIKFGRDAIVQASCSSWVPAVRYIHPNSISVNSVHTVAASNVTCVFDNVPASCAATKSIHEPCASAAFTGTTESLVHPLLFSCLWNSSIGANTTLGPFAALYEEERTPTGSTIGLHSYLQCPLPSASFLASAGFALRDPLDVVVLTLSVLHSRAAMPFAGLEGGNHVEISWPTPPCAICAPNGCHSLCDEHWGPQTGNCYESSATCGISTPSAVDGSCCDCPGAQCPPPPSLPPPPPPPAAPPYNLVLTGLNTMLTPQPPPYTRWQPKKCTA